MIRLCIFSSVSGPNALSGRFRLHKPQEICSKYAASRIQPKVRFISGFLNYHQSGEREKRGFPLN